MEEYIVLSAKIMREYDRYTLEDAIKISKEEVTDDYSDDGDHYVLRIEGIAEPQAAQYRTLTDTEDTAVNEEVPGHDRIRIR